MVVSGNNKVGNLVVSFTDLELPMAGLPISVIRTYDGRAKRPGEFGVGWSMELANLKLEESVPPGSWWELLEDGLYCYVGSQTSHTVSLTWPWR